MPTLKFLQPNGTKQIVNADENISIMQAATEHSVPGIFGSCGGAMACATCHIYIDPKWKSRVEAEDNEQSDEEIDMLDMASDVRESSRLGCQIKLTNALDGLVIALPGTKTNWE
jgi:2Fe-2S ferredoxin